MRDKGIILYTIGCEPLIGDVPGTREFFKGLSDITGGRYLSLHDAKLLPAIIVGGAEEEAALQRLNAAVEEEIQNVRSAAPELRDDEVFQIAAENCAKKNIVAPQMEMDMQQHIPMARYHPIRSFAFRFPFLTAVGSCIERSASLNDARVSLKSNISLLTPQPSGGGGGGTARLVPLGIPSASASSMRSMHLSPPPPPAHYAPGLAFNMTFAPPAPIQAAGGGSAPPLDRSHSLPQSCSMKMSSLTSEQVARISKKGSPSPFSHPK
jgi:hypothetical protein